GVVHALLVPQAAQQGAIGVVAERAEVGHTRALARRRDGEVRGVATEALQVQAAFALTGLVELDHRLAQRDDVEGLARGHQMRPYFARPLRSDFSAMMSFACSSSRASISCAMASTSAALACGTTTTPSTSPTTMSPGCTM